MLGDSESAGPSVRSVSANGCTWLDVERPTGAELSYLTREFGITPGDLDSALGRGTTSGTWQQGSYLATVLHLPSIVATRRRGSLTSTPVTLFVGSNFIVTVRVGELRPLVRLFRECETDEAVRDEVYRCGMSSVILAVMGRLLDTFVAGRSRVERAIGPYEDAPILEGDWQAAREGLSLAIRLRLDVRELRRLVAPLAESIQTLEREIQPGPTLEVAWARLKGRSERLAQSLDEDLLSLEGIVNAAQSSALLDAARDQRLLTAIAGLTLPVIAVAAVLAMPGGNPLVSGSNGYAYALGVTGVVFLVALFVLQRCGII